MKNLNLVSEDSLTLKSGNCCDTSYYSTECPNCGALFHRKKSAEPELTTVTVKEILDNLTSKGLVRFKYSILDRDRETHTYYGDIGYEDESDIHIDVSVPKKLFKKGKRGIQDIEIIGTVKEVTSIQFYQRTVRHIVIRAKSIKPIGNWTGKEYIFSKQWQQTYECPQCGWVVI